MVNITIFELNLDGSEFNAKAPWDKAGAETATVEESDDGGARPVALLAVAGFVVVAALAAVAVKKFRGGDGDSPAGDVV